MAIFGKASGAVMRELFTVALLAIVALSGCVTEDPLNEVENALDGATTVLPATVLRSSVAAAVAAGEPAAVPVMDVFDVTGIMGTARMSREFDLTLTETTTLVTNETWAMIDDNLTDLPDIDLYEGYMTNSTSRRVALAITDEWARGVVLPFKGTQPIVHGIIRVGLNGNMPYQPGGAAVTQWDGRDVSELRFDDPAGDYNRDCLELVPPHVEPTLSRVMAPSTDTLYSDIILDADYAAYQMMGDDTFAMMIAMMHEVDAIYYEDTNTRFRIAGVHLMSEEDYYPDPDDEAPLGKLADYWNERDFDRDIVHLFTGIDSGYAMANCIGGAGHPEVAYTFTSLPWAERYTSLHMNVIAHELGHILSAHHHYGNHAEQVHASIMIQGYTQGLVPQFSTISKSVIRGWVENEVEQ